MSVQTVEEIGLHLKIQSVIVGFLMNFIKLVALNTNIHATAKLFLHQWHSLRATLFQ